MTRWWVIDALVNGRYVYIGKCHTTLADLRETFARDLPNRRLSITGNHVVVF